MRETKFGLAQNSGQNEIDGTLTVSKKEVGTQTDFKFRREKLRIGNEIFSE